MSQPDQIIPLSNLRKMIAERMSTSLLTAAQYTLQMETDATNLVECKKLAAIEVEHQSSIKLTYTPIFIKITAHVLQSHPQLNAQFYEETIHQHQSKNIGVAVTIADGLIVPIVKSAETKSLGEIASIFGELTNRATNKKLTIQDVTGGTFTISNLGSFGIDSFTPILNLPEVAILGINRIALKPRCIEDQIVARHVIVFSLTVDHRIINGAEAASFLKTLRETLQDRPLMNRLLEVG